MSLTDTTPPCDDDLVVDGVEHVRLRPAELAQALEVDVALEPARGVLEGELADLAVDPGAVERHRARRGAEGGLGPIRPLPPVR